jgi:hypothetical protein
MFLITNVIVKFAGPNHLRVDRTAFTHERRTKAVQIPRRESHAELVKVFGSRCHYCTMRVGKVGDEAGLEAPGVSFNDDVGEGWHLSPVLAEDLAEQVHQQATNAFH